MRRHLISGLLRIAGICRTKVVNGQFEAAGIDGVYGRGKVQRRPTSCTDLEGRTNGSRFFYRKEREAKDRRHYRYRRRRCLSRDRIGQPSKTIERVRCAGHSLGGGTWVVDENRELIKRKGLTSIWLESTFEHCWYNIKFSHKERPLARDKDKARKLFEDRKKIYCLADWHFIIKPEYSSYDIAKLIYDEYFL